LVRQVAKYKEANEVNIETTCNQAKFVVNATNSQLKFEASAKPEKANSVERHLEIKNEAIYKPYDDLIENTSSIKWGSPKFSSLRVWLNSGFLWDNAGKKQLNLSTNFQIQDAYHVGFKLEHDTNKFKSVILQGVHKVANSHDGFFRYDTQKKHITVGCNHALKKGWGSSEITFDTTQTEVGIWGQPLTFKHVGEFAFTD